ncbi:MAG: ATP-binding protein [Muricoprocola sp.]
MKRLGKNSKPFFPDEMSNRFYGEHISDFSSKIVADSTLEDVNLLEVYSLKEKLRVRDPKSTLPDSEDFAFLRDLGLIKTDGEIEKLTVAGLLFVGKQSSISRLLPSAPRNKLIAETLQHLKYVQRTGQGVDIIYREMVSMGKPYPEYHVFSDAVSLTLRSSVEDMSFVKFVVAEQEKKQIILSLAELMILRYVTENKQIKLSDAKDLVQLSLEDTRKCCLNLVKLGLIETVGKEYMLTARVYEMVKSDVQYTRDKVVQYIKAKQMIVDYLETNGTITNVSIQELCGFTKQQARATIDKMRKENIIDMIGKGKASKYVLVKS